MSGINQLWGKRKMVCKRNGVFVLALVLVVVAGVQAMSDDRSCRRGGRDDASNEARHVVGERQENKEGDGEYYSKELHVLSAVLSDDYEQAKPLLESKVDADVRDKDGYTVLMHAAALGQTTMVQLLLDNSAAMEAKSLKNSRSLTPLMYASACGKEKVVELLLARGANKDVIDSNGASSLTLAINNGHRRVVQALVAGKVDVNKGICIVGPTGRDMCYPLEFAIDKADDNDQVVEVLLDSKAMVNLGTRPCHWSSFFNSTPLVLASVLGKEKLVKLLLARGANKDAVNGDGDCSLALAIDRGHFKVVRELLASEVDVRSPLYVSGAVAGRYYPLEYAAYQKMISVEVIKLLLDNKAKPDPRGLADNSTNYAPPLMAAAEKGCVEVVKLLLEKKADVRPVHERAGTALACAIAQGHTRIAPHLIYYGSDMSNIAQAVDIMRSNVNEKIKKAAVGIADEFKASDEGARNGHDLTQEEDAGAAEECESSLDEVQRMEKIIEASQVVISIMPHQDWNSAQLLLLLRENTFLSAGVASIVDSYASHKTEYEEVNDMVEQLIADNQAKRALPAELSRSERLRGWVGSAVQRIARVGTSFL